MPIEINMEENKKYIFSLVIILCVLFFLNMSFNAKVKNIKRKISTQELTLQNSRMMLQQFENLKKLPFSLELLKQESQKTGKVLYFLETTAKKIGIELERIKSSVNTLSGSEYSLMNIKLIFNAETQKVFDFLYDLESSDFFISVEKIDIISSFGEKNVKVSLELSKPVII